MFNLYVCMFRYIWMWHNKCFVSFITSRLYKDLLEWIIYFEKQSLINLDTKVAQLPMECTQITFLTKYFCNNNWKSVHIMCMYQLETFYREPYTIMNWLLGSLITHMGLTNPMLLQPYTTISSHFSIYLIKNMQTKRSSDPIIKKALQKVQAPVILCMISTVCHVQ